MGIVLWSDSPGVDLRLPLSELRAGDEVILHGTIDHKTDTSASLVLDGVMLGRVARIPLDVMAEKTGESPNYRPQLLTEEEKRKNDLAAQRKYYAKKKEERRVFKDSKLRS